MSTISRRLLPSTAFLASFEAAARHQSFTAAAVEMNLTQGAVSRQIRALEEAVGTELFLRDRQTVRLTDAGAAYASEIRAALQQIANATLGLKANPRGGSLNLAILPTFGTRWLAPRLPGFLSSHPGITLNLTTRLAPFDFGADTLDAAIHFGKPNWPGANLMLLMRESVVAACSARVKAEYRIRRPRDLLKVPLMHLTSRPNAWEHWFQAAGVDGAGLGGMRVDQFAVAAQAAIAGMGVALLPRFLIEDDLAQGNLVAAVDVETESEESYYLAWPAARAGHPPLRAFRAWIEDQVGKLASRQSR